MPFSTESNLLVTTTTGRHLSFLLRSDGTGAKPVDFVLAYKKSGSFLVEESGVAAHEISATAPLTEVPTVAPIRLSRREAARVERDPLDLLWERQQRAALPTLYGMRPPVPDSKGDRVKAGISEVVDQGRTVVVLFAVVNPQAQAVEVMAPQVQLAGKVRKGKLIRRSRWGSSEQLPVKDYRLSRRRLGAGERLDGVVVFDRPNFKQANEALFLQIGKAARLIVRRLCQSVLAYPPTEGRPKMASENEKVRNSPRPDTTVADEVPPPQPEAPESAAEPNEEVAANPGRLAQLVARLQKPPEPTRDAKAGERTRALVILAGTGIACLFLFFGLFTTDGGANRKERRNKPNLGRPEPTAAAQESANRSAVPQLSVTQQPNDDTGELSEKDLLATMRNRGTPAPTEPPPPPAPPKPAKPKPSLAGVNFEDPALMEAYRRQGLTPPPRKTEVVDWNAAVADYQAKQKPPAPAQPPPANPNDALRKSSLVFVRSAAVGGGPSSMTVPTLERKASALLPQGTALVARLQHAVSSAAKVPVVAVIEYNYEQDGQLVVPAGSKAYGELSQVTPQGWVTRRFNVLELPGGQQEKIAASAISMERTALRGEVNGKNSGKKFLTRALTGVGTIAALRDCRSPRRLPGGVFFGRTRSVRRGS